MATNDLRDEIRQAIDGDNQRQYDEYMMPRLDSGVIEHVADIAAEVAQRHINAERGRAVEIVRNAKNKPGDPLLPPHMAWIDPFLETFAQHIDGEATDSEIGGGNA